MLSVANIFAIETGVHTSFNDSDICQWRISKL